MFWAVGVHVCGYCGSELDAQDNYVVLRQFADLPRPSSPFHIGMTGEIDGVTFTITGTLGTRETWGAQSWTWVDHQIFSPTHGYAYLTCESGHLKFSRKYRASTQPRWFSPMSVEISESGPVVRSGHERFQYFETTRSEIIFVEGEFNWEPQIGAKTTSVSVLCKARLMNFSASETEEEVIVTTYFPGAETYALWNRGSS